MAEFSKRWPVAGGLLIVPFLAVLVVSSRHDQGRPEASHEPTASAPQARPPTSPEPEIRRAAAAPAIERVPEPAPLDDSRLGEPTEADIERTEKAVAALNQIRPLVAEGRIPASSMTSVERLDARIEELKSGRTMPDPAGVRADPRARERARDLLTATR